MATIMVKIGTTNPIEGEATLSGYENQIECSVMRHAIDLPVITSSTSAKRVESGGSRHGTVELTHRIDKASPKLRQNLCQGSNLGTVTITRLASGNTKDETIELKNAHCQQIQVDTPVDSATGEPADEVLETFCLSYDEISWQTGAASGNISGSHSLTTGADVLLPA